MKYYLLKSYLGYSIIREKDGIAIAIIQKKSYATKIKKFLEEMEKEKKNEN